ncbi:hypothetical protein JXB02_03850 [Candidatus Woesearchaeota archaeon]|nr:hypothetical protein [Candidatus Woesearchaeota archaeon]
MMFAAALALLAVAAGAHAQIVVEKPRPVITASFDEQVTLINYSLTNDRTHALEPLLFLGQEDNTFRFQPEFNLADGTYTFDIAAEDNVSNPESTTFRFEVAIPTLGITLISPSFGVSPSLVTNLIFTTSRFATCRWSHIELPAYNQMIPFQQSAGSIHVQENLSIFAPENTNYSVYVRCMDEFGYITPNRLFRISWDSSPPVIRSLTIDPSDGGTPPKVVQQPPETTIVVGTDDETRCKYSTAIEDYEDMTEFPTYYDPAFSDENGLFRGGLADGTRYTYHVACENRAELVSALANISFVVDLAATPSIRVISPSGTLPNGSVYFALETNKNGNCYYSDDPSDRTKYSFPQLSSRDHHVTHPSTVPEGRQAWYFYCDFAEGSRTAEATFTVDLTPPTGLVIDPRNYTCSLDELRAEWVAEDLISGIDRYEVAIGRTLGGIEAMNWTDVDDDESMTADGLNLTDLQIYYWSVRAYDRVGRMAQATSEGVLVNLGAEECIERIPPSAWINTSRSGDIIYITLHCQDNVGGSGCDPNGDRYGIADLGSSCVPGTGYTLPVPVVRTSTFCWEVADLAGNTVTGSQTVTLIPTSDDADGDNVTNEADNCPAIFNPDQADADGDGIGDACETDTEPGACEHDYDCDGIIDEEDPDIDGDGIPNDEDPDDDDDGSCDTRDSPLNDPDTCTGTDGDDDGDGTDDDIDIDIDNDLDNDGIPNGEDGDDDGDGLDDFEDDDDDNDELRDWEDNDDDNDGTLDIEDPNHGGSDPDCEYVAGDRTTYNCRDRNDDLDGDGEENCVDTDLDGDGLVNWEDDDDDNDGVPDQIDVDDDNDGTYDYNEVDCDNDLDNDGLINGQDPDDDGDGIPDSEDDDDDNDGIPDQYDNDDNNNGILDNEEFIDSDGDGMSDQWEIENGLDPYSNDSELDLDGDGLTNLEEYRAGTKPSSADSDDDGMPDDVELAEGFDPMDPSSYKRSGLMTIILLIIVILVVVSGGGYLGYTEYQKRQEAQMRERQPPQQAVRAQQVVQRRQLSPEEIKRRQEIQKRIQERQSQKVQERARVFEKFREGGARREGEILPLRTSEKPAAEKPVTKEKDSEWIDISEIGKRSASAVGKKGKKIGKHSDFDTLEALSTQKAKGKNVLEEAKAKDAFEALDRKAGTAKKGTMKEGKSGAADEFAALTSLKRGRKKKVAERKGAKDDFETLKRIGKKRPKKKRK